jgi:4-hydroxy-3-methylbut-2-en-1-yl diphosphate reductase
MSRPAVREIQVSGIRIPRGEVLVPTHVGDPVNGMLTCYAAPLIAGSLLAKGRPVRTAELPRGDDSTGDCDAVVYLTTCPQHDGSTAAIAAGAAPADALSIAAARAVVEDWTSVAASRTLLMAGSPWCSGALRAAAAARQATAEHVATGRTVHVLTPQAIPAESAAELTGLGAVIASSLAEVEAGDVVVFPAHGVTAEVRAEAAERGATVVDATCPIVAAAQDAARRAADRGHQLVLIGQPGHAATAGITSQAPGHVTVVESVARTAALKVGDSRDVSYMLQPGLAAEAGAPVIAALRSRYPAARVSPDELCYAPSDRAGTIFAIAAASDLMVVLGDPESADARQLCGQARDAGAKAQVVSAVGDIRPAMLSAVRTIGLAESTSASATLAGQVTSALSGLGRLSVARRQLSTEKAVHAPA